MIEVAIVGALLSLVFLVAVVYVRDILGPGRAAAPVASVPRDQAPEYRVGSILLVLWGGDTCEERGFDNLTGHVISDGFINCDKRLAARGTMAMAALHTKARLRAISTAFKK
jgi:hypothetical protein